MSKPLGAELPDEGLEWLIGGNPVVVATVDAEGPYACIVGSCVALDKSTLRFAMFGTSRTLDNLRADGRVFVETLGDDLVLGITGTAAVVKDPMEASAYPPHAYVMIEVKISAVKDDYPPGSKITGMSYDFAASRDPEERMTRRSKLIDELLNWQES